MLTRRNLDTRLKKFSRTYGEARLLRRNRLYAKLGGSWAV